VPDAQTLQVRLEQARAGLPFRPEALTAFLDAAAASRTLAPLRPADLAGTPIGARLEPLLTQRGDEWRGPIVLRGVIDPTRLAAAVRGASGPQGVIADVLFINMRAELGGILSGYMRRAWRWLGWSGVLVLLVLGAGLRDAAMAGRVIASVLTAMLVTIAALTAFGVELSLIHLVALQLVAGVGLDYALFFARRQLDGEERARTMRTLVTCNAMTLLTFGLLALCRTPLLRDIGVTVACGAVLAMVFAFFGTGEASRA
jgi:predicted exporter